MTSIEAKTARNEEVEMLSHIKLFAAVLLAATTAALAFPPSTEAVECAASTTPVEAPCATPEAAR